MARISSGNCPRILLDACAGGSMIIELLYRRVLDGPDSTIVSQESRGQESFNNGYTMGSVNVKCTIFDKEDTKMVEIGLLILDFVVDFFMRYA